MLNSETIQKLEKKKIDNLKEKAQYGLTLGVVSAMLYVMGFPLFIIIFFGIFAFLLWKVFSLPASREVHEVFEFYLQANEILRDDERRWFGFEIQEAISKGEQILKIFPGMAPPLLYFTIGALYYKLGDYRLAENYLSKIVEKSEFNELAYTTPSDEIRKYAQILRKVEADPSEAPLTSAAVRALERARRNKAKILLEESRKILQELDLAVQQNGVSDVRSSSDQTNISPKEQKKAEEWIFSSQDSKKSQDYSTDLNQPRKSISEVLHDIYDEK
jgi:tetratricopeptide (TPR) repeat protein